jgi:hypothetical protein
LRLNPRVVLRGLPGAYLSPHGSPTTQVGATMEVAPRKEEREGVGHHRFSWSNRSTQQKGRLPRPRLTYSVSLSHCLRYSTSRRAVENEVVPHVNERGTL